MKSIDKYATFDHRDSKKHDLLKIELFTSVNNIQPTEKTTDLSVVFKNHSNRLLYLDQISGLLPRIKSEIFIYEKNFIAFIIHLMRQPLLMFKWRKYIFFKSLDYSSYLNMISRSVYTLDIAHPRQTGTTLRCFEALDCKAKIISNNKFILTNPLFNETNVIIHAINGDVEKLYQLVKDKWKIKGEFKSRSIDDFFDELLA